METSLDVKNNAAQAPAPELRVAATWDSCIENTIRKLAYGAIGGGILALVLFRSPTARSTITGLGAGTGVGMGYTECKQEFDRLSKEEEAFRAS